MFVCTSVWSPFICAYMHLFLCMGAWSNVSPFASHACCPHCKHVCMCCLSCMCIRVCDYMCMCVSVCVLEATRAKITAVNHMSPVTLTELSWAQSISRGPPTPATEQHRQTHQGVTGKGERGRQRECDEELTGKMMDESNTAQPSQLKLVLHPNMTHIWFSQNGKHKLSHFQRLFQNSFKWN